MGIVRTEKKQNYGNTEEELFSWCILGSVVNLFPHVEIVVSTGIELKGNTSDIVEHEVGAHHICNVNQGPRSFL